MMVLQRQRQESSEKKQYVELELEETLSVVQSRLLKMHVTDISNYDNGDKHKIMKKLPELVLLFQTKFCHCS